MDPYPVFPEFVPELAESPGTYGLRFARTVEELEAVQRLRFDVFNVEMGEGLEESYNTGRDQDRFDPVCHHLIVTERRSDAVVGTYRMQTGEMARRHGGFYSGDEFDLDALPAAVLDDAVEVGRASVAKPFRNRLVLFLLWQGLAAYMQHNRKRYLFGCCSLTSQDREEGRRVMRWLRDADQLHPLYRIAPRAGWECYDETTFEEPCSDLDSVKLPQLFRLYLRYGARVCSCPALDRHFKTIDYLVLLDTEALDPATRGVYFEDRR